MGFYVGLMSGTSMGATGARGPRILGGIYR
jgi:hypothetical protein